MPVTGNETLSWIFTLLLTTSDIMNKNHIFDQMYDQTVIWTFEFRKSLGTKSSLFAFYHYPCATFGGQVVPEGTCRVVFVYECRRT